MGATYMTPMCLPKRPRRYLCGANMASAVVDPPVGAFAGWIMASAVVDPTGRACRQPPGAFAGWMMASAVVDPTGVPVGGRGCLCRVDNGQGVPAQVFSRPEVPLSAPKCS